MRFARLGDLIEIGWLMMVDIERGYGRMGEVMIGLVMLCEDG